MIKVYHRLWSVLPFIIALASFAFLAWGAYLAVQYPQDGIVSFGMNGQLGKIDPAGAAYGKLQEGDIILKVDGRPFSEAFPFYGGKHGGDVTNFLIERNGSIQSVSITLTDPKPTEVADRLIILIVALAFWLIGSGVQTFKPSGGVVAITFLFFQASSIALTAGASSYYASDSVSAIFSILVWLLGPFAVHFHLTFPQVTSLKRQRLVLVLLYGLAIFGSIPYLIWDTRSLRLQPWASAFTSFSYLFLVVNLLGVLGLLVYAYNHTSTPGARGKIRIVVLGGVLATVPLIGLNILPAAISLQPIIPYSVAFLLLSILPLTYGYAIFRHHLIEIEKHVNRGATFILVYSILGAFYVILYAILHEWLPIGLSSEPFINTVLILALASAFVPLQEWVKKVVDTAFYGGWYDYRSAVRQITQGLEQVPDLNQLARTIGERLVKTLRLEDTCVFLRDFNGEFSVIEVAPREDLRERFQLSFPTLPRSSLIFLLKMGELGGRSSMRDALAEVPLTPEEQHLLNSEQVHLWVPIIGHGQVQGYLALGPKYGGDIFSGEDMDILRMVAWQLSPIIENIHLLTQLRHHAADLEQKVYERTVELYEAKERVEAILASVGDGVVVTDLDGIILIVNSAFEEQVALPASVLLGYSFNALLAEHNDPRILQEMSAKLQNKEIWTGELVQQRKGSKVYNIQLTIAPVYNQTAQVIGYVGSQRDITKQRELDRLKDQFISDVSHELRTPATNLGLYLELLETALPEKRSDYLGVLKSQCHLLTKMVEDILDLSRLELGKSKKMEFSAIDLNFITDQVVTAHRPLAEASRLTLEFCPEVEIPLVRGEQNQLARVITNLVSNAIRYTLRGEVRVSTFVQGDQVCLEVRDTGIGIDPEDQLHLYERFFRGRQVRRSNIHGTGLGLAIVKEIVDLHGGSIELDSEVGKGSSFRIWLPSFQGAFILQEA